MEPRFPASSHLDGAQRIGAGGCGIVYTAKHARWGQVAAKVAISADDDSRRLFATEYALLRSFRHAAILKAYDLIYLEDDRPAIIMQLCDGGDLYQATDPLPLRERFRCFGRVLSAIEYLHLLGLIHRDLKGENVLISKSSGAQLSDLGLASSKSDDSRERGGTLEYMAPEVIANKGASAESDIYSVGVILYRMATGALPFVSSDPVQIISRKQQPDALPLDKLASEVSPRFARLVRQCIDPNPGDRPKNAKEVAEQLSLDNLINAADFGSHKIADLIHHYVYSYNASFCKQELKQLPRDFAIAHHFQEEAVDLAGSIADYLKQSGFEVVPSESGLQYRQSTNDHQSEVRLMARAIDKQAVDFAELDRFAFDRILSKFITKEIDPATANLIFELSSGNLALVTLLLNQLERENRFEVSSGKLKIPPLERSLFQPDDTYFQVARLMLPQIPVQHAEVAGFLSADTGEFPVADLAAMGRLTQAEMDDLVQCGLLNSMSGSIARGYYRSCLYHNLDRTKAQQFHSGWIKIIGESDDLPALQRERLLVHHNYRAGAVQEAIEAAMRLADLLQGEQNLEESASVLEFACNMKGNREDLRQYVTLLKKRADLLNKLGDFTASLSAYSRVVRFGRRIGYNEMVAAAYKRLGDVYKGKRDYMRGKRALDRAVEFYGEKGNELELSHCYNNLGNIFWINGDLGGAAANYEKALVIQRELGAMRDIASTLSNLGSLRCMLHGYDSGIPLFKESIEIKKQLNDLPELARTYNNLAVAYFELDELATSHEYLMQSFEINQRLGAVSELHYNYDNFHELELRRGNYSKAREWLIEGLKNSAREAHSARGGFITSLAALSILEGRYAKAGALLAAARAREEKVTDRQFSMRLAGTYSDYYYNLQDYGHAYDYIQTAIEYAQKIGEPKSYAIFLIRRARIERAISRPVDEIRATLADAENTLASLPGKREKHELILDYAELALATGDVGEVEIRLAEAIDYPEFDGIVTFRARLYLLRGLLEIKRENYSRANQLLHDAVLAAKSAKTVEMLWYGLLMLGDSQRKTKQLEQSLKSYIEAFNTVKQLAGEITDKRLRKLYLTDKRKALIGKRLEEMSSLVA
ncbi:MAG: serine/threonine protein kinase [bacterium]|nr:serine/threonine protein kinase [bacterium]